ncbi:hypothetical protein BIW11_13847 [Tropilaelaps mercedesae]|uniref:Uncharacterized protein n=1 Tax=Tropilaelaps mercedesae TaxID=418985 RepID=A0A1V9X069_9ACAR|nr:hypothetical protein BIW11_13847 [Tropilaelaps mercedesae]
MMATGGYVSPAIRLACILVAMCFLAGLSEAIYHHKLARLILFKGLMKRPRHIPLPLPLPIPVHKDEWGHKGVKPLSGIQVNLGHKNHHHHRFHELHHLHDHHSLPLDASSFDSSLDAPGPKSFDHPIIKPSLQEFAGIATNIPPIDHFLDPPFLCKELSPVVGHTPRSLAGWNDDYDGGLAEKTPAFTHDIAATFADGAKSHASAIKVSSTPVDTVFLKPLSPGFFAESPGASVGFHDPARVPFAVPASKFVAPAMDIAERATSTVFTESIGFDKPRLKLAGEMDFANAPYHNIVDCHHSDAFHEPVPYGKYDLDVTGHPSDKVIKSAAA